MNQMDWRKLIQSWQNLDCDHEWMERSGATESEISDLELRISAGLPTSYRNFLKVVNGCGTVWCRLFSVDEVRFFRESEPELVEYWRDEASSTQTIPDELYFTYGDKQDCCHARFAYLENALQISNEIGGSDCVYLLLVPEVASATGEWEAWHLGNKFPGAFRYQSFEGLMSALIGQERLFL